MSSSSRRLASRLPRLLGPTRRYRLVERGGPGARLAAEEFFAAQLTNPHTRRAYGRPVFRFLEWCQTREIELRDVSPGDAALFIEQLGDKVASQKIALAAMVVTDLLEQGVPMEDVQYLVGHSHPSTAQIYDRRARKVTRNIVERISA